MAHQTNIQEKQINDAKTQKKNEEKIHREIEIRLCRVAQAYKLFWNRIRLLFEKSLNNKSNNKIALCEL